MRRHATGDSGTTLVEVAVGLAVGSLLVAGILVLVGQAQKSYMHSSEVTDLQQNVRVAMDRVVRVIQAAGVNPMNKRWGGAAANNPAFTAFREAGRNCIRVYADLNGDGDLNVGGQAEEADENVYFHWSTTPGAPLTETRGPSAGASTSGTVWVSAVGVPEDLARDIVANPVPPSPASDMFQYFTGANDPLDSQHRADPALAVHDGLREPVGRGARTDRPGGDHPDGARTVGDVTTMTKTLTSEARARNVP